MPKLTYNNKKLHNVRILKTWIEIPIKNKDIPNKTEHYLVSTRVADYIELLEKNIKEKILKLKDK